MVSGTATSEELSWFAHLGRAVSEAAGRVKTVSSLRSDREEDDTHDVTWKSFDLAHDMERGMAQVLTTGYINPHASECPETRLKVQRSDDRLQYSLTSESGDRLLLARVLKDDSIGIFIPTGGDPPLVVGPAFTLTQTHCGQNVLEDPTCWTLACSQCECCVYLPPARAGCRQQCCRALAYIRTWGERTGECNVMHMEADLPPIRSDGVSPETWCERSGRTTQCKFQLASRAPRWNARLKTLTLDFYRRVTRASAKNIQLEVAANKEQPVKGKLPKPEFLHGKVSDNTFVLDYRHPIGMAQAFGMALATRDWH